MEVKERRWIEDPLGNPTILSRDIFCKNRKDDAFVSQNSPACIVVTMSDERFFIDFGKTCEIALSD